MQGRKLSRHAKQKVFASPLDSDLPNKQKHSPHTALSELRLQRYFCKAKDFVWQPFMAQTRAEAVELAADQFKCSQFAVKVLRRGELPPKATKEPWGTQEQQRQIAIDRIADRKFPRHAEPTGPRIAPWGTIEEQAEAARARLANRLPRTKPTAKAVEYKAICVAPDGPPIKHDPKDINFDFNSED